MIVVDTNVIGYPYLASERSTQAEQALRRDSEWAAPLLWRSEVRNVLWKLATFGKLAPETAHQMMDAAENLMSGSGYEIQSRMRCLSQYAQTTAQNTYDQFE